MVIEDAHTHTHTYMDARVDGYTLTVEDAAAQLGKSVESVRRYIRTGKLHAVRVEGKNTNEYRINPDDLGAIYARTQSHTQPPTHAGDRTGMGVSVEIAGTLAHVEQTHRQLLGEITGLRESIDRLAVALVEDTQARAHDRVTAPPPPTPARLHPVNARFRVLRWLAHQFA